MPAANPRRLESQVEALVGLIHDPNLLQKQAVEILTYYADRTRRPGVQRSTRVDPPQLNVPSSVLRTLRTRLKQALDIVPDQAVPVADAMWEAGLRETQLLAVSILGCMRSAESSAWVEARFPTCRDPHVLARLADEGLAAWRLGSPQAFLERAAEWTKSPLRAERVFGLLALTGAVSEPRFEDVPSVFAMLTGVIGAAQKEERRALQALLMKLAERSAPETTRFLLDHAASGDANAIRLTRAVMQTLPKRQRALLNHALSR